MTKRIFGISYAQVASFYVKDASFRQSAAQWTNSSWIPVQIRTFAKMWGRFGSIAKKEGYLTITVHDEMDL